MIARLNVGLGGAALAALGLLTGGGYMLLAGPGAAQAVPASVSRSASASSAASASTSATSAPASRGDVPTVRLAAAVSQDVPVELQANGTVVPLSSVEIHSRVSRLLTRVHVKEGQYVTDGALLFALDDRSEQAALERAQAQVARDQSLLTDLERQYRRSQELSAQSYLSTSATESLQTQLDSQRALLHADQAALRAAQVDLSYTVIRAPSAGRVGAINVYPGSLVQVNAALASVTRIHPIAVSFALPESGLAGLLDGQKNGPVAVSATLAEPARTLQGRLSFIYSAVDAVAGTIRVKAEFQNPDTLLWPGQYVRARLTLGTLRSAIVVPLSALATVPGGAQVYVVEKVNGEQLARARTVRVLHADGNVAAVSGIAAGERIIVEGRQNLRSGARVKVAGAEVAPPAAIAANINISGAARLQ